MSKEARPSSCRLHASNRYANYTSDLFNKSRREQNPITDSYQIKVSLKQRPTNHDSQLIAVDSDSKAVINTSRSKFLQKFNTIRSSRESMDFEKSPKAEHQRRRKEEFESNKKKLFVSTKTSNKSGSNTPTLLNPFQENGFPIADNNAHRTLLDRKRSRPQTPNIEFVELRKISESELILLKQQGPSKPTDETLTGYWKDENRYVSLIPLARNQKVSFQHPNVLPIYAEVTINAKRYVISDEYKNCSLKNLLDQFGPFKEQLGKRYLKQIALGLQHMHYHRRGHNRLSATAILYNKNGELFINAVRSTSFVLSKQETKANTELHYFAPQFLLSKGYSKSLKNDVWALGCLAILMLTNLPLKLSPLHPYNFQNFQSNTEEKMIDNLKQLHQGYFSQPFQTAKNVKTFKETISESAKNFISRCLQPLSDERPSIETLLDDQFFQGV